ncbi:unnamed protein product [Leuciscus chuanchicus]
MPADGKFQWLSSCLADGKFQWRHDKILSRLADSVEQARKKVMRCHTVYGSRHSLAVQLPTHSQSAAQCRDGREIQAFKGCWYNGISFMHSLSSSRWRPAHRLRELNGHLADGTHPSSTRPAARRSDGGSPGSRLYSFLPPWGARSSQTHSHTHLISSVLLFSLQLKPECSSGSFQWSRWQVLSMTVERIANILFPTTTSESSRLSRGTESLGITSGCCCTLDVDLA